MDLNNPKEENWEKDGNLVKIEEKRDENLMEVHIFYYPCLNSNNNIEDEI